MHYEARARPRAKAEGSPEPRHSNTMCLFAPVHLIFDRWPLTVIPVMLLDPSISLLPLPGLQLRQEAPSTIDRRPWPGTGHIEAGP